MNYEKIPIFRTRAHAANSNRRAALDYRFAARWERLGGRPFRSGSPEVLVDLASEGALVEPRGRPLINCQLFGTQFIRTVVSVKHELVEYQADHGPVDDIAFIRIRPSRDPDSKTAALLDERGNASVRNLRAVHVATSAAIQRALQYMGDMKWFSPLVIGRHADPMNGGAAFDWHEHVTGQMSRDCSEKVATYLYGRFGRDRVWISTEEEPGVRRDLVYTGCYPAAKLAGRGYDEISDEHLLEFIAQSRGLRRVEVTGAVRAARDGKLPRGSQQISTEPSRGPEAELAKLLAERDDASSDVDSTLSEGVDAEGIPLPDSDTETAPPFGAAAAQAVPRTARLLRCHFAYFDLTLRWVARVSDYTGWDDLRTRYDLALDVADAKALAARAADLLSLNPATPEYCVDESLDLESLVGEWGPLPYDAGETGAQAAGGASRPAAEPQHDRGPQAGAGGETGAQAAGGASRPAAEPQHDRGPKAFYPLTSESSAPANEPHTGIDGYGLGPARVTVELTVRSEHGPATATVRVELTTPSGDRWPQASRIAG